MSELPLPEDVTRWPSDPFELLGVRRGSDEKELKRAYQRLLRVYRPERFPEEFRRLRDAYETAKMWSQWVTVRDEEETETAADGDVAVSATNLDRTSDDGAANATTSSEFPAPLRPRVPSYEDRLRDAGEAARDGRLIEAYAHFGRLMEGFTSRYEAYLACYWLLRLDPALDPERAASEWLTAGLARCSNKDLVLQAYLGELERNPESALYLDVAESALSLTSGADALRVFEARWRIAAPRNAWSVIRADLVKLQATPWWLDRNLWLLLMTTVLELISYSVDPEANALVQWCRTELDHYPNVHASQFDALARLDGLRDRAVGVQSIQPSKLLAPLRRMISLPSSSDPREGYLDLIRLIHDCESNPATLLARLSSLKEDAWNLLPQFQEFLDRLSWSLDRYDVSDWRPEELRNSVGEFFSRPYGSYNAVRTKLLEFCLERFASPHDVVAAMESEPAFFPPAVDEARRLILQDRPLYCAYTALRIFGS